MKFTRLSKVIIPLLFLGAEVFAQTSTSPFVLPQFVNSTVLQKGGASVEASLNYNIITQEMMFEKDGTKLVMDQTGNVDSIYLAGRKFVPVKQLYYEKLTNTAVALFIQYTGKAVLGDSKSNEDNKVVSEISKKAPVEQVDPYNLQLPAGYIMQFDNKYWLTKGKDFVQVSNVKKLAALFPGKETQIEAYIKENSISLTKQNDLIKLITFCNQ